ncbi:ferrochelatase [Marinobacterium arenosum]|uniref:ferrochelatase n=1 Tax=Marinobacterium arenosum TaxID=2862496 RepID=UPI001C978221|nr:ferrochelatase [Marinobacterium arenosum]MBY4678819.1 ferrochelatase [Marinobacterium arenosum]
MTEQCKTAVVLVNLGTPDRPEPGAVRRYLAEFLADRRVVEGRGLRRLLWLSVLHGVILRVRPRRVAHAYQTIWLEDSPMRMVLNQQVVGLNLALQARYGEQAPQVFAAMSYGQPGLRDCLQSLADNGYQRLLILPLYPQYSATTTAPVYDQVAAFQQQRREVLDIRILKSYCEHPRYIRALADSIRHHREQHGGSDKLVLSYHGIPQEYADKGDPYPQQCQRTSELVAAELGLGSQDWLTTFQSRFGPAKWLQPYTDKTLQQLPGLGVASVDLVCPAFSADCLETLEEIAVENRDNFLNAGGSQYRYIPALNAAPAFIELLEQLVREQAGDWLGER